MSTENNSTAENNLIVVTQLPIIEEQLLAVKDEMEKRAEKALSLVCTVETLASVKKERAELSKLYKFLEEKRIEAKKAILAPYEEFEKIYRECVTSVYAPCDKSLADKIRETEAYLKDQRREETEKYYEEYCRFKQIDGIPYEAANIAITLSKSAKALRTEVKAFVDRVADDLSLIATQEYNDEILVEYKKTFNASQSITTVIARHKAIDENRRARERALEAERLRAEAASKVEEAAEEIFEAPTSTPEEPPQDTLPEEKLYEVSFTVRGTMDRIKALKNFLVGGNYQYEQQ